MTRRIVCLCLTLVLCTLTGAADREPAVITAFVPLAERDAVLQFPADEKPTLTEILSQLPATLRVCLDGAKTPVSVPVEWFCVGGDYEKRGEYYYQFSPQWDTTRYVLDSRLDVLTEAPYVGVFLTDAAGAELLAVTKSPNEAAVFEYLTGVMGLNAAAACGVMANIQAESYFNPHALGDNGTSYGICQWHNERWTRLKDYCSQNGYDSTTLDGQLHYLDYELTRYYSSVLRQIRAVSNNAQGAYDAASVWCIRFEIPANKQTVAVTRGNLAKNSYWPQYRESFTVTFSPNGGTVAPDSQEVTNGEPYGDLPVPARDGYTFGGWFTAESGGEQITAETVADLTEPQTLYARWNVAVAVKAVSRDGDLITADIQCDDLSALVFCAVYLDNGKMVAVQVTEEPACAFRFENIAFDYANVFILDSSQRPLCEGGRT